MKTAERDRYGTKAPLAATAPAHLLLLGPFGGGKMSLFNFVTGLSTPSSGRFAIAGGSFQTEPLPYIAFGGCLPNAEALLRDRGLK